MSLLIITNKCTSKHILVHRHILLCCLPWNRKPGHLWESINGQLSLSITYLCFPSFAEPALRPKQKNTPNTELPVQINKTSDSKLVASSFAALAGWTSQASCCTNKRSARCHPLRLEQTDPPQEACSSQRVPRLVLSRECSCLLWVGQ